MKMMIAAPHSNLHVLSELMAAAGIDASNIFGGTLSHREFLNALRNNYDIIHFAGHGTNMQLQLSDGPLSVDMIASALTNPPVLVFLNACASLPAAAMLYSYGTGYAIGWRAEVPDKVAGEFAVVFYRTMSLNGGNIRKSFETAENAIQRQFPGQELPVLLNGRMAAMMRELQELRYRQRLILFAGPALGIIAIIISILSFFHN